MRMIGTHLPDGDIFALDAIARERRVPRAVVLRWAIIEYLNQHRPQHDSEQGPPPTGPSQQLT
jgi:hypothetical protein